MLNPDTPALNANGTLKDASEIEFVYSPTAQGLQNPEKWKQAAGLDQEDDSDFDMLSSLPGLKGKELARWVASKHVKKASVRATAAAT